MWSVPSERASALRQGTSSRGQIGSGGGDRRIDAQYTVTQANRLGTHGLRQLDLIRNEATLRTEHDQPFP